MTETPRFLAERSAEKLAHDLEWIADRSVRLYLRTLASTEWRVLRQTLGAKVQA